MNFPYLLTFKLEFISIELGPCSPAAPPNGEKCCHRWRDSRRILSSKCRSRWSRSCRRWTLDRRWSRRCWSPVFITILTSIMNFDQRRREHGSIALVPFPAIVPYLLTSPTSKISTAVATMRLRYIVDDAHSMMHFNLQLMLWLEIFQTETRVFAHSCHNELRQIHAVIFIRDIGKYQLGCLLKFLEFSLDLSLASLLILQTNYTVCCDGMMNVIKKRLP